MKKFILSLMLLLPMCVIKIDAQVIGSRFRPFTYEQMQGAIDRRMQLDQRTEPGNNLGKTLSQMRAEFPDIQYEKTIDGEDLYYTGGEEEYLCFGFRYDVLVQESMYVSGDRNFRHELFRALTNSFDKTRFSLCQTADDMRVYHYSTFRVDIVKNLYESGDSDCLYIRFERK
ncbi:MAG: hypothetical protein IKH52_08715 [Bacteroidaceae bacterium]|nr:hypothetical protein [Bacteroidaceae bacterium]